MSEDAALYYCETQSEDTLLPPLVTCPTGKTTNNSGACLPVPIVENYADKKRDVKTTQYSYCHSDKIYAW